MKGAPESGLMGPLGAYLNFVLYVIPYPQHHNPEHRLRKTEGQRDEHSEEVTSEANEDLQTWRWQQNTQSGRGCNSP